MTDIAAGETLARETLQRTPRALDGVLLVLGLLALWQVLHLIAGDVAVASPAATIARLGVLLTDPAFWPHLFETLRAFGLALVIAFAGGLAIGSCSARTASRATSRSPSSSPSTRCRRSRSTR